MVAFLAILTKSVVADFIGILTNPIFSYIHFIRILIKSAVIDFLVNSTKRVVLISICFDPVHIYFLVIPTKCAVIDFPGFPT